MWPTFITIYRSNPTLLVDVVGAPIIAGLVAGGAAYGIASYVASNEASQLSYLINDVDTMQNLAASSPTNTVNVYVSTDPDYYAPAVNLTWDGASGPYVANSIATTLVLLTSFSDQ